MSDYLLEKIESDIIEESNYYHPKIKRTEEVKIKKNNLIKNQNNEMVLNKLFFSKEELKKKEKAGFGEIDKEKEHELQVLENLFTVK